MLRRLLIPALFAIAVGFPEFAWACSCVVDPSQPFTIPAGTKGMVFTGTVRAVQQVRGTAVTAVLVDVGESLLNAPTGEITIYTASEGPACGFKFQRGRIYVIQTGYLETAPEGFSLVAGAAAESQIVSRCGKTRELNTPAGELALAELRRALGMRDP